MPLLSHICPLPRAPKTMGRGAAGREAVTGSGAQGLSLQEKAFCRATPLPGDTGHFSPPQDAHQTLLCPGRMDQAGPDTGALRRRGLSLSPAAELDVEGSGRGARGVK